MSSTPTASPRRISSSPSSTVRQSRALALMPSSRSCVLRRNTAWRLYRPLRCAVSTLLSRRPGSRNSSPRTPSFRPRLPSQSRLPSPIPLSTTSLWTSLVSRPRIASLLRTRDQAPTPLVVRSSVRSLTSALTMVRGNRRRLGSC
jgi:hypothetical protein